MSRITNEQAICLVFIFVCFTLFLSRLVITVLQFSAAEVIDDPKSPLPPEQTVETSLWERLGKAAMLDIESPSFSWDMLSSLHHTEHSTSTEQSEDETNKALEVCG